MIAYVTSVGEPTTDLCIWALERHGIKTQLLSTNITLAEKLQLIYKYAKTDFLRVDADVIVNRNITKLPAFNEVWWYQYKTFDWWRQDLGNGGVQYISKKALPFLRQYIGSFMEAERPETQMFRLPEFDNPRRCITLDQVMGLHGYGQDDVQSVIETKTRRGQLASYDFELAEQISKL